MIGYVIGLLGMWLLCGGIIRIRVHLDGVEKIQGWRYGLNIRIIRGIIGLAAIVLGWILYN